MISPRGVGVADWELNEFRVISRQQESTDSAADDAAVARLKEYFQVIFVQRQIHRLPEFICPNIRFVGEGATRYGYKVIEQRAKALLTAFDPIEFNFERIYSKNQIVVGTWVARQKHSGEFQGVPATGRWVELRGTSIAHCIDGLFVEAEDQFDVDGLIRQLTGLGPRLI